jgi:hypothetical protein
MSKDKTEGREVAPSVNPEERSNLDNYKSKDKASEEEPSITTVSKEELSQRSNEKFYNK